MSKNNVRSILLGSLLTTGQGTFEEPYSEKSNSVQTTTRIHFWLAGVGLFLALGFCQVSHAITRDVLTSRDQNTASKTVTTPAFTTKNAQELLLAFVSTDENSTPNATVQSVTGGGLTWVLVVRTNTQSGTSEIWRTFAPSVLTNATVSANLSQSVVSSLTIESFSGTSTTGTNGSGAIGATGSGHAPSGAPTATLVTTANNSLVVGVGNDYDKAVARTPGSGQAIVHQLLSSTGDTYWVQQLSAQSAVKGTKIAFGDSAPTSDQYNLSICEILPAGQTVIANPAVTLSPSTLAFGSVTNATSKAMTASLSSTGTAPLTISALSVSGTGFSIQSTSLPVTLSPGATLAVPVTFAPKSAGAATGNLMITSNSSTGTTSAVALTGTGVALTPQLTISTTSLSFGSVTDGTSKEMPLTLTSTGGTAVTVNSLSISGAGFSLVAANMPLTLAAGQSLTVEIAFAPSTAGSLSGTLTVNSTSASGASTKITLSGTGAAAPSPKLTLNPAALSLGSVTEGASAKATVTLSSTGTSAVTVSSASVTGAGFSIVGGAFPISLSPGATTTLTIQFAPTATGTETGLLTVSSNSTSGSTSTVALSGFGEAAVSHTVGLTWDPPSSSSEPVTGYYVFRATGTTGTYTLLNSSVNTQTAFTDSTVISGTTYTYQVTSVDSAGVQSVPSNVFTATIP